MKRILWLYAIPHIYLINWLQFFSYGMAAAIASFALFLFPFALTVLVSRKGDRLTWVKGSAVQFASNMVFTLITNQFAIVGGNGGTWRGATGVFYAEQLVLVLTVISLLLQAVMLGVSQNNQ